MNIVNSQKTSTKEVFRKIEHLLGQNEVLKAIHCLQQFPEYVQEALLFSRRWHATQTNQQKQLITTEQAEVEINRLADAILAITTAAPQKPLLPTSTTRSELQVLSQDDVHQIARQYSQFQNEFKEREKVIIDHATGLMWQKVTPKKWLTYEEVQRYVEKSRLDGYDDWRIPAVSELMTLLEHEKNSEGLYLHTSFHISKKEFAWYWSKDMAPFAAVWRVNFYLGEVRRFDLRYKSTICAVRDFSGK